MAELASTDGGDWRRSRWRLLLWSTPILLLLLPAVAMRFTDEVKWDETDFIFMGVVLFLATGAFDLAARASGGWAWRAGAAIAILAAFLIVWVNLAVGMIGDDNPYNLLFAVPIAIALAGSLAARFRPRGTALAMAAAAAAHLCVAAGGHASDPRGAALSAGFAGFWAVAGWLFWRAGR